MIISIGAEKTYDKIQQPFRIKTLQKVGTEGTYFNVIKVIYYKPMTTIILSGKKPKTFLLRSGEFSFDSTKNKNKLILAHWYY